MEVFGNLNDGFADGFGRRSRFTIVIFKRSRRKVAFRKGSDASHGFNGFYRIETAGRFAAEHDGIGAVDDGIGNVTRFSTSRTRVVAHRFQHLSCRDDRFTGFMAFADEDFLEHRDFFCRYFDTKVTTGDHDAVAHLNDFINIIDSSLTFDLRNDLHFAVVLFKQFADGKDVFAALNEGSRNEVHIHTAAKFNIGSIRFRDSRKVDGDTRYGNALTVAHLTAVEDFRMNIFAFDADDFEVYQTVG